VTRTVAARREPDRNLILSDRSARGQFDPACRAAWLCRQTTVSARPDVLDESMAVNEDGAMMPWRPGCMTRQTSACGHKWSSRPDDRPVFVEAALGTYTPVTAFISQLKAPPPAAGAL